MADGNATAGANANGASVNGTGHAASKKNRAKKSNNAKEQDAIAHRISELEGIKVNEREQELEIEREVKKASREFSNTLSSMDNMAKVHALTKRSNELLTCLKRLERELAKTKRQRDQAQKERDSSKSDLTKMTSRKDALEKLSREATNEVKKLRVDLQRAQDEETKRREELQDRMESMVLDVQDVLTSKEQARDQTETFATDDLFRQKFRSFIDQYDLRELQMQSMLRMKDLEISHHVAKLDQQKRAQEMESSRSSQLTRQVTNFSQTETELRSQLNIYVEKFKQVEDTLNSSNDLFLTFRKEMEEMSKKTKRLEKENLNLTRKHDATNQNIIKMAEERTRMQKELGLLRRKNENLEKLCRGMQAQGRGQGLIVPREHPAENGQIDLDDDEGTESEYEDDYEDDDVSLDEDDEDDDYDDESDEAVVGQTAKRAQPAAKVVAAHGVAVVGAQRPIAGTANGVVA